MSSARLEVNGESFEFFSNLSVTRSIETLSGTFNFQATIRKGNTFPIKSGDACRVFLDDVSVIDGFAEKVSSKGSSVEHSINVSGRDKTADLVDSSVVKNLTFQGAISLKRIIENVLTDLGLSGVSVIDESGGIPDFTAQDREAGGIGVNAFDFLGKYARKRQVLLTTNGSGNIIITRGGGQLIDTALLHQLNGTSSNNVLNYEVTYDESKRFYEYKVKSQLNPSIGMNDGSSTTPKVLVDQSGMAIDSGIRKSRKLTLNAESSSSNTVSKNRALIEANLRRARAKTYRAAVQGFSINPKEGLWRPNLLVRIVDDFAQVDAQMLIRSVNYNQSLSGSITTLEFVVKDAYTLQAELDSLSASSNKLGASF